MLIRFLIATIIFCLAISCKQANVTNHAPKGFAYINDTCFVQHLYSSNQNLIKKNETIIIEKIISNEFDIEIPFTQKPNNIDTIVVAQINKCHFLFPLLGKLHVGDTAIIGLPWQGLFKSEKLQPTVKLAASQMVFVHLVIKQNAAIASDKSIKNKTVTNADSLKIAATKPTSLNNISAIKQQKVFVPLSGDEYEKEEFTLRYFLEYTKPYMLKHEIQPGFFLLLTQKGTGDFAQMGDVVTIDYVGRFAMDGKKFDDSSFNPDPFEFELGKPDQILKGLEKALYRMRLGSRAEVYFSSRYGYGAQGSSTGIVGKYKSLTFAVHLKKINKKQNELN